MAKTKKTTKPAAPRSLRRSTDNTPFFTFRITQQTIYWLILSILVLALGIWITYLNIKVQTIYDHIETINSASTIVKPTNTKE